MVIWSGMTCLTGAAMSFGTLFLARMGVGIGEAGCAPTSFAILSEIFPSQRRPLAISVFQAGGLLGIATGMFMAGIAAQYLGWRLTLGGLGIAGIPIALMVAYTLRDIDASSPRRPTTPTITDLKVLLTRPVILHIIAGISLASFGTYAIIQWSAAFFIRTHGVGLAQIGMVSGLTTGIGGIAGTLGGGWLAGRLIRRDRNWDLRLPAIAYLAAAPIFAATFGVASTNLAFALNFCATTVAASAGGVALASLQRFAEAHAHRVGHRGNWPRPGVRRRDQRRVRVVARHPIVEIGHARIVMCLSMGERSLSAGCPACADGPTAMITGG
jgi:predicted MFS family arabinose efflux permease